MHVSDDMHIDAPDAAAKARTGEDSARNAFFFDVDGTLLELRPRPEDVRADPPLRQLIVALQHLTGGALALVSGRALSDLDRIFAAADPARCGPARGGDPLPRWKAHRHPAEIMDHARPEVGRFVAEHPGLMLEDKGATLALHFRQRPEMAATVLKFMRRFAPGDEIAVQEGKFVVELKPASFDKGTAIATLMKYPPFNGRAPVFYGDDLTDEAGFSFVNKVGGLSVRIGAARAT